MDPRFFHRNWRYNLDLYFFRKIDDRKVVEKFEFWGMVIFYGFDPFLDPMGTYWPQDGPKMFSIVIWLHDCNFHFL